MSECGGASQGNQDFSVPCNPDSKVKKVIGVVSGKGGVGKSFVTSYMACLMSRKGYKTAIMDADITGPSIPKAFGIHGLVNADDKGVIPAESASGVKVMSANLLLESEETPIIWRGAMIANAVKQFWSDVQWGEVDYMFVDMPPGTGDVPLTVFQSLPVDGIIIVTSPQELVSMIVAKAVGMANAMDIPVMGLVENYSYVQCGTCGEKISVFGESHVDETAARYGLPVLGKLPLDPAIAAAVDKEQIESLQGDWLNTAADLLEAYEGRKKAEAVATRIAVTMDENENVFQHFGKTERFAIYTIDNGMLRSKEILSANGKGHDELSTLLIDKNVTVLICGGIGAGAMEMLTQGGITVIPGARGNVDVNMACYLDGSLRPSDAPSCGHHHGEEGGHSCCCH